MSKLNENDLIKKNLEEKQYCLKKFNNPKFKNSNDNFIKCNEQTKCSPHIIYDEISCLSFDIILNIFNIFASKYNKQEYNLILEDINKNLNENNKNKFKKKMVDIMSKLLGDDHSKWIDNKEIKNLLNYDIIEEIKLSYLPELSTKRFKWLDTNNIEQLLQRYEIIFPDYKSFGAVPYDFQDLDLEISNLNIKELKNQGYTRFSVVFNLDKHYQSGSHWVSLYCCLKNNNVYFFDSVGEIPGELIINLVHKIINQLKEIDNKNNINYKNNFKYNNKQHQYENSECGVYSILFIVRLLYEISFEEICIHIQKDRNVNLARSILFKFV